MGVPNYIIHLDANLETAKKFWLSKNEEVLDLENEE